MHMLKSCWQAWPHICIYIYIYTSYIYIYIYMHIHIYIYREREMAMSSQVTQIPWRVWSGLSHLFSSSSGIDVEYFFLSRNSQPLPGPFSLKGPNTREHSVDWSVRNPLFLTMSTSVGYLQHDNRRSKKLRAWSIWMYLPCGMCVCNTYIYIYRHLYYMEFKLFYIHLHLHLHIHIHIHI